MSLQNLQAEFASAIMHNDRAIDGIVPAHNIAIYQNNVFSTLSKALLNIYPFVTKLVGEDFFRIAAKEYIQCYPSGSGNLHDYGEYFSDFITHYPPAKNLAYLSEVAQFEWLSHTLFFAADATTLNVQQLQYLSAEHYAHIHFILHPASHLLRCNYPLLQIIALCKGESDAHVELTSGGVNLLMLRGELATKLIALSDAEFIFLTCLQQNQSLSIALDAVLKIAADFSLEEKLVEWIKEKVIVDYNIY